MTAAVTLTLATVGCDSGTAEPEPSASASSAGARFSGFAGPCPALGADAVRRLGVTAEGRPVPSTVPTGLGVTHLECAWGEPGTRPRILVTVSIHPDGFPPGDGDDNARRLFESIRAEAAEKVALTRTLPERNTASGPTLVTVNAALDKLTQSTLVDNAVVTVVVEDRERSTGDADVELDDLEHRLAPTVDELVGQVVAELR
ncbi:MAG TPA: hypothetical protein VGD43_23180 [Micromonospora sp.]